MLPVWGWGHVISSLYIPGRTDIPLDPVAQLHGVARAPWAFVALVGRTLAARGGDIYRMAVGDLGWVDTALPGWFYPTYGIGLLACIAVESGGAPRMAWWQRLLLPAAALACALLVFLAMYANWNAPGSRTPIDGIQGRYFLPLAPLVLIAGPRWGAWRAPAWAPAALGGLLGVISAAVCLWAVVTRYYL